MSKKIRHSMNSEIIIDTIHSDSNETITAVVGSTGPKPTFTSPIHLSPESRLKLGRRNFRSINSLVKSAKDALFL
jgi:hypothetical protein